MPRSERTAAALLWVVLACVSPSWGQDSLMLVNDSTTVSGVQFRFVEGSSFATGRLQARMATRGPTFVGWLRNTFSFLPFVASEYPPFDAVELQRDMVRLGRFYRDNGFLAPLVDYPASQYDAETNRMQVIVTVREGPPLSVRSRQVTFTNPLDPSLGRAWRLFVERLEMPPGTRYTEFGRIQVESRVLGWMRDRGYAFAEGSVVAGIDSAMHAVDLSLLLSPGVRATIDRIDVEGANAVSERTVTRHLPFTTGSLFKADDLLAGQRDLLGLGVFRVALADVPEQTADSTVSVRVRVREAPPHLVTTQGGYSWDHGMSVGAGWRNRNFLGGARSFQLDVAFSSGVLARPGDGREAVRSADASLSLRQPYVFDRRLSGSAATFYRWVDDPNQAVRFHEIGVSPSLLFQYLPFRAASLQYTLSHAIPIQGADRLNRIDVFDRSVLTVAFAAGKLNNYLHPRRGWMVRPTFDLAGTGLGGNVAYRRATVEATGLIPITMRSSVSVAVTIGRLFPSGASRDQSDAQTEYRFDPIRYYAGGATDVRGWGLGTLGPKWARADTLYLAADGTPHADGAVYESVGGLGKLSGRVEFRFPAPGLSDGWRFGTFLDFGAVGARLAFDDAGRARFGADGLPVVDDRVFPGRSDFRFGTGFGIRYLTPVGALRLDLAWKVNPDDLDLQSPADRALFDAGLLPAAPPRAGSRRWGVHLSIDRAF